MEDKANDEKKTPLDDIINHMTANWHSYGIPPGQGPGAHVWASWPGSTVGPGRPTQPFYVMGGDGGGGEPSPPVFFQADQPPPGYEIDSASGQTGKPMEFFNPASPTNQTNDRSDMVGTMVDLGGGNFVNVVYSGGPGGTVNPQYLSVNSNSTATNGHLNSGVLEASTLENILSYSNQTDPSVPNRQLPDPTSNYNLFRELQPQQVQSILRQQQLQHIQVKDASQSNPSLDPSQGQTQNSQQLPSHHQPNLHQPLHQQVHQHQFSQPAQTLLQQQVRLLQQQQIQQKLQQHFEQQQLQRQQQVQQKDQEHTRPIPSSESQDLSSHSSLTGQSSSVFSQNQDQLIQNLVGNWTGPNQSGRYNPFGLALSQENETMSDNLKEAEPVKKVDKSVRRTRIVAEVRPMRPSYSSVLTTPSPVPSPQKPNQPGNNTSALNLNGQNNCNVTITNNSNKINTDRPKTSSIINSGKSKNLSGKSNGLAGSGGKLKRQHSSGSDEPSSTLSKAISSNSGRKSTGLSSSSSGGMEDSSSSPVLSRRWVSLDDLENDADAGESQNVFKEAERNSASTNKDSLPHRQKVQDNSTSRSGNRSLGKSSHQDEAFLNNQKAPSSSSGSKGVSGLGPSPAKRPIQINNNLGTSHGPHWNNQQTCNNTNATKGEKFAKSGKSGHSGSDERKGSKNESKSNPGSSNVAGLPNRSGRGSMSNMADKAAVLQGKRHQRGARRKDGVSAATLVARRYGKHALLAVTWFFHLLSDVVGMSLRLFLQLSIVVWQNWIICSVNWLKSSFWRIPEALPDRLTQSRIWRWACHCLGRDGPGDSNSRKGGRGFEGRDSTIPGGLTHNISMPATGEEAMKRLLACKGKDPYSILGVTPTCCDDDVKKYYKRQAFLVHPDKNSQPGAEEAFKILVHAFELIGEPEKRAEYDRCVAETQQVEQAWSELSDLLSQLHQKMEYAANTIRCTNCGKRHKRIAVPRKPFAARFCAQCKIKHSAKEGDIWAETMVMGFLWHYYACMEGAVYDITDWASCQTNNLRHLKPNSHNVQYRIVLGRQRQQHPRTPSEPDLENFLSSLYSQTGGMGKGKGTSSGAAADGAGTSTTPPRQDNVRSRKKGKRNK